MDSCFAPAKRTEQRKFKNQINAISHNVIMDTLLKTVAGVLIVLNEDRQVVSVNQGLLDELGIQDAKGILGLRIGEVLSCVHANELPNGCGTTPDCMTCGAAIATMAAIVKNETKEQICVLTKNENSVLKDICLMVRAQPIEIENHKWILFFAQDITHQQYWLNMERVFFHDVSNLLTSLMGNNELLAMDMPQNQRIKQNHTLIEKLCNEISLQMSLLQHKDKQYQPHKSEVYVEDIRKELHTMIGGHTSIGSKKIKEIWPEKPHRLFTDRVLLTKVIGNMVINALEATPEDGEIRIKVQVANGNIIWEVWNAAYIPEEYHHRIFQRFFSTKSINGRGLGTYSMKIYGEKLLNGKICFSSEKDNGTVFSFTLPS